jgi:homotetrameric cytidine deaminase
MSPINRQQLIDAAITARTHAYAPYSRFLVGAAVLIRDGRIFMGCNIENAAYPSTNCAERVAMQSAWAVGARDIIAIAVVADTPGPVSPCGGCRQVPLTPTICHNRRFIRAETRAATIRLFPMHAKTHTDSFHHAAPASHRGMTGARCQSADVVA